MADILDEGKKLVAYSMVCAYGKTETRVDILHKPSQGEVQLILTHTSKINCNSCAHTIHIIACISSYSLQHSQAV